MKKKKKKKNPNDTCKHNKNACCGGTMEANGYEERLSVIRSVDQNNTDKLVTVKQQKELSEEKQFSVTKKCFL